MRKKLFLSTLAIPLLAISGANGASVLFDFRTANGGGVVDGNGDVAVGSDFDPSVAGDTIGLASTLGTGDDTLVLTATIVDIFAPEFVDDGAGGFVRSGMTISTGTTTNISGQDALGLANPSINNTQFDAVAASGNNGSESSDFNDGESLVFTFDQDVIFTSIELESINPVDTFDVLVNGVAVLETTGDDEFIDDLGGLAGLTIIAGSEITFAAGGNDDVTSFRIETFQVDVVPEPSSSALIGLAGLMMLARRRR